MKGIFAALLALTVALSFACAAETPTLPMLRADGTRIVDADGQTVLLRGVNVGGWLVQEAWMNLTNAPCQAEAFRVLDERFGRETREWLFSVYEDNYLTEADFDNIRALGMNVVRVPFAWWNILTDDGELRADAFDRLDWAVRRCAERGMYVILDLHAARGSQNNQDNSGEMNGSNLWKEPSYQDQTVFLWEQVAAHYKDEPAVAAYDLLNEPGGDFKSTGVTQWEFFDRACQAIRAVDAAHIIMVESCWDPEDLPAPDRYGWENVVYQYHFYKWNADNDYRAQKLNVDVKLHKIGQAAYPVPSFLGEFTLFQSMEAWEYALNAYSAAGMGWTIWTYKVTGDSTWGLYNVFGSKADIYKDSAETIEVKWRGQGTLRRNTALCEVVAGAIAGEPVTLKDDAEERSDVPVQPLAFSEVSALPGATVEPENGGYRLTTASSIDPRDAFNAIRFRLQESANCASYCYLTFFIRDLQGSNTHRVTLIDAKGASVSAWVDVPSVHGQWTRINVPLSMYEGIDLKSLSEIRIGEWNSGAYCFDRLFLCHGAADE
ncbi:MAG: cellulase family glycosylhydrolase [Clostridia bacterium]|nr:cellulase family glycosylhydrolase [Clostridia bacterium]